MTIDELIKEGKLHRFEAKPEEIDKCLEIARRDLPLAEKILVDDLDWCFSITYNAIFQACRAYMFSLGYRPAASEAHKTTFEFMELTIEEPYKETITYFDRVRKKRHKILYDEVGLITEKEADELLRLAKSFIAEIEKRLKK
jgi:uncharacterized protein (UPF0332 family)